MARKLMREESENYFWFRENELGRGATSMVFKCQHNKTGEEYAAKVFNSQGMGRPKNVTERELNVLRKLMDCSHENIVKIIAIENVKALGNHVTIMEYCSGGSLHNMLDKPENAFGFEERNFKQVVFDVVSGMKYLNDQGMIHRDIKPGNILRYVKDDGSCVYKLTDFGSARELAQQEEFTSIYGTEEYLHPDLYERGVLKNTGAGKAFTASVDLWSLGVTFYHIATGKLPFRAYGGRSAREKMYEITSKKDPGIISGIQKLESGPIEWSDKLPEHTRLSQGLKEHIVKILAKLFEADPRKGMKFDELFRDVEKIRAMKVIHIYNAQSGTFHTIYADPEANFACFQELVAIQTSVSARQQYLFYSNEAFKPDAMAAASTYPDATEKKPIIVLGRDSIPSERMWIQLEFKKAKLSENTSSRDLDIDAVVSKMFATDIHHMLHIVQNLELSRILTLEAAHNVILLLRRKARKYLDDANGIENHCNGIVMKHQACLNGCKFEVDVIRTLGNDIPKEIRTELDVLVKETDTLQKKMEDRQQSMVEPLDRLRKCAQTLLSDGELAMKWKNMNTREKAENYVAIIETYTRKVEEIRKNFQYRKIYSHMLGSQDIEDHKFERLRLEEYFSKAKEAMETCQRRRQDLQENLQNWLQEVYSTRSKLKKMRDEAKSFIDMFQVVGEAEEKWRADHMVKMKKILNDVRAQVRRAISVPKNTPRDAKDGGNYVQLGSEFIDDISDKLDELSSETKETKLQLQKGTETFKTFVQKLMDGLNEKDLEGKNEQ